MTTIPEPERPVASILAARGIRTVFQPIVELDTGAVLGYEALSRGPAGSTLERPDLLFAAARAEGVVRELDLACRESALAAAQHAGLHQPYRLFVNAEPDALGGWRPSTGPAHEAAVILELTERALVARPAELLRTVARVRAMGWGIALDDVGADPSSLALLPLLAPDVIKLDLHLVQQHAAGDVAMVVSAVHAEAERSGALVLAEGLETEQHVETARSFGATLGQGWHFGRPEPLPAPVPPPSSRARITLRSQDVAAASSSPYEVAAAARVARDGRKGLLIAVSKQLEAQARQAGPSTIVLSTFQHARQFTPDTAVRYAALASTCSFVAALGAGLPVLPAAGVRGASLADGDPLLGEWDIAVLGPHFAAALVARDLGDDGPERSRRFTFVLTHDRDLVIAVATRLMMRVSGRSPAVVQAGGSVVPTRADLPEPRVGADEVPVRGA